MNYLAHALLAGPDDDYRLGGLLGDFVKGPLPPTPSALGAEVLHGLVLHRRIDSFADAHVAFRRSRQRISAERRRYSGIIIDLFYDHFLAVHWGRFSEQALEAFTAGVYALLARHRLPERLAQILPRMRADDWLASYREPAAVGRALDQIASRRVRPGNSLAGAGVELGAAYGDFESDFLEFFPAAMAFAEQFRRAAGLAADAPRPAASGGGALGQRLAKC
ncbi:MAG: DUF479 domain-containing protein [Rhodobacteraceae bacterium]|uniref:acyl carrier protein phosphodiesterase n=1 Tax=Accumulibacter sp. TaxID=2053492 RepID=UPI0019E884AE|nr:ACP phosphodiesterase [Accumulibacter sp.]MBE2257659.1 DUF479 domain-containing protein [Paracoccaceae bacterium]